MIIDKSALINLCDQICDDDSFITQDQCELLKATVKTFCDNHPSPQIDLGTIVKFTPVLSKTVNTHLVDSWLELFIKTNVTNFTKDDSDTLSVICCQAISAKQTKTIKSLIDAQLVGPNSFIMSGANKITPLIYCLYTKTYDPQIFDMLLPISDINYESNFGTTALYKTVEINKQYPFDALMNIPSLDIKGYDFSYKLFDEAKNKPHMFNQLVEKLNHKLKLSDITDVAFCPIAYLSKELQDKLRILLIEMVDKHSVFTDVTLMQRFMAFVNNPEPLPFKHMNRLSIAVECVLTIVLPDYVKQAGNTCGPATLMQHLAIANPEMFIHSVLEIAELSQANCNNSNVSNTAKHLPATIKTVPQEFIDDCNDLWSLWIATVRHNYNIVFGYSAKSQLEMFLGMTTPYQLAVMFEDFGYEIKAENFSIRFSTASRPGFFLEKLRQQVQAYVNLPAPIKCNSFNHVELSTDQRFDQLRKWFASGNFYSKTVTILMDQKLAELILKNPQNQPIVLYVEPSHFANIKYFEVRQTHVEFSCLTYGKSYECRIPIDDFKKGYLGGLFVEVKDQIPRSGLETTPKENKNILSPGSVS